MDNRELSLQEVLYQLAGGKPRNREERRRFDKKWKNLMEATLASYQEMTEEKKQEFYKIFYEKLKKREGIKNGTITERN